MQPHCVQARIPFVATQAACHMETPEDTSIGHEETSLGRVSFLPPYRRATSRNTVTSTLQGIQGADAAFRISGLELGGLLGSLSAGAISDKLIRGNNNPDVGNVGLRVKVGAQFVAARSVYTVDHHL